MTYKNCFTPYHEHMNDLSSDEVFEGLLAYGLFSEKTPPIFTAENFYSFYKSSSDSDVFESRPKDYVRYENIRNINVPRPLSIPHPFAYANLCKMISDNWENLKAHFETNTKGQEHKISRIHIRKIKNKSQIFEMSYPNFKSDGTPEYDLQIKAKYIVHADISNCFPSIYSHSIPWVIQTKEKAKTVRLTTDHKSKKDDRKHWSNDIDREVMNCKCGETNGLFIGPHASNVISEIILVTVDNALYKNGYRFTRHIDDYKCYAKTRQEADRFLVDLAAELKKVELSLNHKKSAILSLPQNTDDNWVQALRNFHFPDSEVVEGLPLLKLKTLSAYLDLAVNLMLSHGENSAILNYVIKTISGKYLGKQALNHYLKRIHHLVILYPYLAPLLDDKIFQPFSVDTSAIFSISRDLYEIGMENKWYEACSYAVFFALKYNITIPDSTFCQDSIKSNDCIFMILAYLYSKNSGESLDKYEKLAIALHNTDPDRYWLFIYEVLPTSELTNGFNKMKDKDVSFIKTEFNKELDQLNLDKQENESVSNNFVEGIVK